MFEKYLTKQGGIKPAQPQKVKSQWYLEKFKQVHGDTYDYSQVVYTNQHSKVLIICRKHGVFSQDPNNHSKGKGCPTCGGTKKKTTEEAIKDFVQVHGDLYDYSSVRYTTAQDIITITCKQHGPFPQKANDHLNGSGCPKCQGHIQDTLYILKCNTTELTKIGITGHLTRRVKQIGGDLTVIFSKKVSNPRDLEKILHKKFSCRQVFNPTVKSGGTEFFNLDNTQVEEIIRYLEGL